MKMKNGQNERGAIVLESTYCILFAAIMLVFLMSFGFFLYQNVMVTVVANEVAEEVSQTYKLRNVTDSSSVSEADVSSVGKYRYLFFADRFETKNETKAKNLANVRLSKTSLAEDEGAVHVDVKAVVDDIGRRHYEITVQQKYSFMLGKLLSFVGQRDIQTLEKTVYVESSDVLHYVNTVKMTQYGLNKLKDNSSVLGLFDSAISLLHSIFDD